MSSAKWRLFGINPYPNTGNKTLTKTYHGVKKSPLIYQAHILWVGNPPNNPGFYQTQTLDQKRTISGNLSERRLALSRGVESADKLCLGVSSRKNVIRYDGEIPEAITEQNGF